MLLTQTERDFLLKRREFTRDQQYYIKSRLVRKIKVLFGTELPLLDERGYLAGGSKDHLAACCKIVEDRVAWLGYCLTLSLMRGTIERMGRRRFELRTPAMSRRYPNQARPPALYTLQKFVAQIYVIDPLSRGNALFSLVLQG